MVLIVVIVLAAAGLALLVAGARREARRDWARRRELFGDVLADVRTVWPRSAGFRELWSDTLLARLVAYRPGVYGRWSTYTLAATLREARVRMRPVYFLNLLTGEVEKQLAVRWCRAIEHATGSDPSQVPTQLAELDSLGDVPVDRWEVEHERFDCPCGARVASGALVAVLTTGVRVCGDCIEVD